MKGLALLLVTNGLVIVASASSPATATDTRLMLGGIGLGQSEQAVVARLGKPQRRVVTDGFLPITLSYPGIDVHLDESGVGGVSSSSKKFCTPAKICPGSSYAKVESAYGPSDIHKQDASEFREYLGDDGCWLRLTFQADKVSLVEILCLP